jgi:phosphoglycerate dehydrogenase-like enzyme
MSKTKVGIIIPTPLRSTLFAAADIARLEDITEVVYNNTDKHLTVQEAAQLLAGCRIGIGSWGTPYPDADLTPACPNLSLWVHAAGTVKRMFGPHLEGRDLTIASCAPAIAENVAEITLGQLIIGLKRTLENGAKNRLGKTGKPTNSRSLAACTIGVIGASQVGRRTIRNLAPFGPKVLLFDPYMTQEAAAELGVEKVEDLTEICRRSDAVTSHVPATPATENIFGAEQFQAMPDDAVFVNTARGASVDENALIAELKKGRLFAFLDVSAPEPTADDSPFRSLPNVVYTSHIAGGADAKIGAQAVDDITAFLDGRSPVMAVTPDMLERIA